MRRTDPFQILAIGILIVSVTPVFADAKIRVVAGLPVAPGVFVNGHGPYSFLVDTGANVNLIEPALAAKSGVRFTAQTEVASAVGKLTVLQSDDNEITLDSVSAANQRFVLHDLKPLQSLDPNICGILGQWFLAQFDYTLDLRGKSLIFGRFAVPAVSPIPFNLVNGRMVISTNLGALALDSGAHNLILYNVKAVQGGEIRTLTGSKTVGSVIRDVIIAGEKIWHGDAVTLQNNTEPGVDGILPLNIFRKVYVCNSQKYLCCRW